MSKPLKEDYIIRIKSRIEQHVKEPVEQEEKEEFVELMTRGQFVQKGGSYYITYKETETTGYEGCTTTLKIAADGSRVAMLRFGKGGGAGTQLLIEKGNYGGRVNDTREIRNYPGTITDSGSGLMEKFRAHAQSYATNQFKRTTVTEILKEEDGNFLVRTKRRGDFEARCIFLDMGTKPRILGIPGEVEFAGHGVAYCATCDAEFFKGKEIYVLGAGDQAIEEADYLTDFATKVSIIVLHEEGHLDCNEVAAKTA